MEKELCYFMVNVRGGYSFMVSTADPTRDEEDILEVCAKKDLFEDTRDIDNADVTDFVTEHDIDHFEEIGCLYNID